MFHWINCLWLEPSKLIQKVKSYTNVTKNKMVELSKVSEAFTEAQATSRVCRDPPQYGETCGLCECSAQLPPPRGVGLAQTGIILLILMFTFSL